MGKVQEQLVWVLPVLFHIIQRLPKGFILFAAIKKNADINKDL